MSVVVIGLSHHSSPVELRERFAFADEKIPDALKELRASGIASEAAILSTCNRVEIYAVTSLAPEAAFAELKKFLIAHHAFDRSAMNFTPSPSRTACIISSRSPPASTRW